MIDIITMIVSFVFFWCAGFFLHEVGHWLGAVLTGGSAKIKIWFYKGFIPSMKCIPSGEYNRSVMLWMGGLTTTLVYYLLITIISIVLD